MSEKKLQTLYVKIKRNAHKPAKYQPLLWGPMDDKDVEEALERLMVNKTETPFRVLPGKPMFDFDGISWTRPPSFRLQTEQKPGQ